MKTFTKFFALLFAFTIIGSTSMNAAHYTDPNGDGGAPLIEVWIYGITLDGVLTPAVGDEVAIYNGTTLVGFMILTGIPSATNWLNFQLIGYSLDNSGDPLFSADNPFSFKYWDVSESEEYVAWGWGDGENIDFHNTWYAPTSEDGAATTTGAFFPASGASSYCYVDLTFRGTGVTLPTNANVDITVYEDDGMTVVAGATISAGGYSATDNGGGDYDLPLFAGGATDTDDYDYTVTVSKATFTTETFEVTVTGAGADPTENVYLDGKGDLTGEVKAYDINTSQMELAENALVSTTIDGTVYSDYTDASGVYLISDIPDGSWDFTYSKAPDHVSQTISRVIDYDGSLNTVAGFTELAMKQGTIAGNIYDATTGLLITEDIKVEFKDQSGASLTSVTTTNGAYTLSYYGGLYDIVCSDVSGGGVTYDSYC